MISGSHFAHKLQKDNNNNTKQHIETVYLLEGVHEFGRAGFQKPRTNNRRRLKFSC